MANEYGNYCVLSPLNKHASITLTNGNLSVTGTSGGQEAAGTIAVKTGKWAIEFTAGGAGGSFGFGDVTSSKQDTHFGNGICYRYNGGVHIDSSSATSGYSTWTSGNVIRIEFDLDSTSSNVELFKDNVSEGSVNFNIGSRSVVPFVRFDSAMTHTVKFDVSGFAAAPTSGFLSISTANLPTPAVVNYEDEYYIKAGISHTNGSTTAVTLPKNVSGGAMVRIKRTNTTGSWYIFDTIRGANKFLFGDTTAAEDSSTFDDQNLTGTTLTLPSGLATGTYVVEVFYMGSYFQIKLWTGTSAAISPTFATELDSENGMMLTMPRSVTIGNTFWHKNFTNVQYSQLSDTSVVATDRNNYSAISTTGFTAQADSAATDINTNGVTYVTYAWANSGPYQFGMYRGNRAADGPMTLSSGAPTTFTVKREDDSGTGAWHRLFQSSVLGDNENYQYLHDGRNSAINATATVHEMDFLSNGVKIKDAGDNGNNGTSADHIYGMFGIQPLTDGAINQGRAK